jgi:hypothetical protein
MARFKQIHFSGFLGYRLLQPSGFLDRDAPGGDPQSQGLGPRQRHLPELGDQVLQGRHSRFAAGGSLHTR